MVFDNPVVKSFHSDGLLMFQQPMGCVLPWILKLRDKYFTSVSAFVIFWREQ